MAPALPHSSSHPFRRLAPALPHTPCHPPPRRQPVRPGQSRRASRQPSRDPRHPRRGQPERVRDVRGPRRLPQSQHGLDRALHLGLAGGAVAGHGALDLGRRERDHRHSELARGEVDHAPGVPHEDGGAGKPVLGVQVLDHQQTGRLLLDDPMHRAMKRVEPGLERLTGAGADDTGVANCDRTRARLQHAEPGGDEPRVHPHDAQDARPR